MQHFPENTNSFVEQIKQLIRKAQQGVARSVNSIMVQTYFDLGKQIVEHEQEGRENAEYVTYLLERLSQDLTNEFGKGYSKRNLELIRKFYLSYRNTKSPISQSISWTHYLQLIRISNEDERGFYEIESEKNNWSVRELKDAMVEITLPENNKQIFASKYELILPSKAQFKQLIQADNL